MLLLSFFLLGSPSFLPFGPGLATRSSATTSEPFCRLVLLRAKGSPGSGLAT